MNFLKMIEDVQADLQLAIERGTLFGYDSNAIARLRRAQSEITGARHALNHETANLFENSQSEPGTTETAR